jgi:segregation and condensation protein B
VNPTDEPMPIEAADAVGETSVAETGAAAEPGDAGETSNDLAEAVHVPEMVDASELDAPAAPVILATMDAAELRAALEAILFVVEAPVSIASLAAAVQQPADDVSAAIEAVRAGYGERGAGVELRHVAGGVRIYTRPAFAGYVEMFLQDGQRSRLTQAALETLAVIAYRQPVTRSRVSAIRGVNVDSVVRTLTTRGLVVEVGSDPDTGGGLYQTTELFLEKMGLQSLDELPSLAPLLPELDSFESDEL